VRCLAIMLATERWFRQSRAPIRSTAKTLADRCYVLITVVPFTIFRGASTLSVSSSGGGLFDERLMAQ